MGAVPCHLHHCGVVWHERSCYLESLHQGAVAGTQTGSSVDYEPAVSGNLRLPSSASPRALQCCQKTQFPDVQILQYAFFGPFIGALARSAGGALSDRLGGTRVTLVNFILMAIFSGLLFLTLPTDGQGGSFMAFFAVFLALFLTAGLGSGSTFQMISVIFRKLTMDRVKAEGGSDERAMREAATDTAAALGFISAIGAIGGFFIPKAFGSSLALTGSPVGAMEGIFDFLYRLRSDYTGGIWSAF